MKKQYSKYCKTPIFSILICLLICLATVNPAIFAADSDNSLVVTGEIGQNLESVDLPQVQGPLYLDLALAKTRCYLGERIPVTITLYISDLVVSAVDEPVLTQPEFLFDKAETSHQKQLRINGRPYRIVEFSYFITPLKTGRIRLGPASLNCYLAAAGYTKQRTMEVTTNIIPVNVLALPNSGKPAYFSGTVGSFQLDTTVNSSRVLLGDPVTVRLTISGNGSLQAAAPPLLRNTNGFKYYNAVKRNDLSTSNGLWDKTTFEQVVIPINNKVKSIGPFVFSYFNPDTGSYQQLSSAVLPLSVKPNPHFRAEQAATDQTPMPKLAPIKNSLGKLRLKGWHLLNQTWFWLWQLLPLLLLVGAVIYRRLLELQQEDSPRARAIRSSNTAKHQLAAAQNLFAAGRYDDLLEELHFILRQYLGERFNLPTAGMTGSVTNLLRGKDLPPAILTYIQRFFEQYDLHRFAKTKFNRDEAWHLWEEIKRIVDVIEHPNSEKRHSKSAPGERNGNYHDQSN